MTYDEAQLFLADEMAVLETQGLGPPEWRAQFREAIAALSSCACGGRPSIWEGICSVNEVRGDKAYIDTVYITTYVSSVQIETGRALKVGDKVEVLVFL